MIPFFLLLFLFFFPLLSSLFLLPSASLFALTLIKTDSLPCDCEYLHFGQIQVCVFAKKHQPSYLVSYTVWTISIFLEMKDTKTVTPQVRADITFPFYILLYLSFWTNVMHYVFTDLLDRSLCFKSGDDHILVPIHPPRTQNRRISEFVSGHRRPE